ncbi:MAG: hypothetical protein ACYC7J_02855 [Syntrophales bacterium]
MKSIPLRQVLVAAVRLIPSCLLLMLLFTAACSDSTSGPPARIFTIAVPSENERSFGEKRDFYVVGYFEKGAPRIGNVRIELFRGDRAAGPPLRLIESRVDETGVTPDSAIETGYPEGEAHGLTKAPDLVTDPGGFLYPGNKVLVTETYFAGIILGGATKDFATAYVDASGTPLEDLTEGVYTLRVSVVSGEAVLQSETMNLHFKPAFKLFGTFHPDNHMSKFKAYAATHGYRIFLDPFAGYFFPETFSVSYEIKKRWRAQNSLEVVNTAAGVSYGTPDNAQLGFILYNVDETKSATSYLELGKALLTGVIGSRNTVFFHYDIGEPDITYRTTAAEKNTLAGSITRFAHSDRLVLTRAEIRMTGTGDGDNRYDIADETPKTIDLDPADGIRIAAGEEFSLFGIVKPIPSAVTETAYLCYRADNRIATVRYRLRNAQGVEIAGAVRALNLGRVYSRSAPEKLSYSIFEFEHEFDFTVMGIVPGTYTVELIALDKRGSEVSGTDETFTVEYAPAAR